MGLNAQTSVPTFTASQVLTAQQQNWINTGIPVFATTVTRDAAFGGTGEKTLAQGQYAYIEATSTLQVYTGSAWITANAGSLVRVGGGSLSGTSTAFASVFSATYNNYLLAFSNVATASGNDWITIQMTGASTNYYFSSLGVAYGAAKASFSESCYVGPNGGASMVHIQNPFLTKLTNMSTVTPIMVTGGTSSFGNGFLNNSTSYTGCTIGCATSLTSGTLDIYGYALS